MVELEEVQELEIEEVDGAMPVPAEVRAPAHGDSVPFFRNWIWWVSLIVAIPGLALLVSMVMSALDHGGEWNWMIWFVVGPITLGCAFAATVLPLLLALGFMLGGKEMAAPPMPVQAPSSGEDGFAEDDEDDVDSVDDLFSDTDADEDDFDDDFDADDDFEL